MSSGCEGSLACDPGNGRCYACVSTADCASPGASCVDHLCVDPAAAGLHMCQACTDSAQCQAGPGAAAAACVVPSGAAAGYCSYDCGPCPSGYECGSVPGGPGKACLAPVSCLSLYTTFGSSCATDDACKVALGGGKCWRPDGVPDSTAGVCSAPCSATAECPPWLAGWTCDATQYCKPP